MKASIIVQKGVGCPEKSVFDPNSEAASWSELNCETRLRLKFDKLLNLSKPSLKAFLQQ